MLFRSDRTGVHRAIRAMGRIDGLVFVGVEAEDGTPLADVGATEQLASDLVLTDPAADVALDRLLAGRTVEVRVAVVEEGRSVGTLRLIADTRDLAPRLWASARAAASGAAFALAVAFLLALRLQRRITRPIADLSGAMARVRAAHDYAVSLEPGGRDEIGTLIAGFNGMIGDIRERDDRLARHRERLEQDVAERTADYARAAREADEAKIGRAHV